MSVPPTPSPEPAPDGEPRDDVDALAGATGAAADPDAPTPEAGAGRVTRPGGLQARAAGEPPSLTEAVGGPLGIAESAVPAALFVAVYTLAGRDATVAAIVAVAVGAGLTIARLVKGQTLQFALSGLFGIALAGFIVAKTGNASDFFLPGILVNIAYAGAYFVSILVRWPLMGLLIGSLGGEPTAWRKDPQLVRTYTRVTWIWVGLFSLRLAVQLPLYLADALVALGVARVAMGIPLFVLGLWLTYLIVQRSTPRPSPPPAAA